MIDSAREALTKAFSLYLMAPPDETFQKKDSLVKTLVLRRSPKRIRYDKDRELILSLPNLNTVTGTQTRVCRLNTSEAAAGALKAGKLIAAAENQPLIKALWLRYAYDPYLDVNGTMKDHTERQLFRLLFGLWCLYPRIKTPRMDAMPRALVLFQCVIEDAVNECRTGLTQLKSSNTFKAEQMGYGKGKAAYQCADYSRTWAPIERDLRTMLTRLDQAAMVPVIDAWSSLLQKQTANNLKRSYTQSISYSIQ